jgi:hypothetical protein
VTWHQLTPQNLLSGLTNSAFHMYSCSLPLESIQHQHKVLSDFLLHVTNYGWENGKNNMQEKAHPGNRDPVLAVAVACFSGVTNWMKVSINSGNPSNWSSWKSLRICEEHHSVSRHGRRQYSNIFIECIAALTWQLTHKSVTHWRSILWALNLKLLSAIQFFTLELSGPCNHKTHAGTIKNYKTLTYKGFHRKCP